MKNADCRSMGMREPTDREGMARTYNSFPVRLLRESSGITRLLVNKFQSNVCLRSSRNLLPQHRCRRWREGRFASPGKLFTHSLHYHKACRCNPTWAWTMALFSTADGEITCTEMTNPGSRRSRTKLAGNITGMARTSFHGGNKPHPYSTYHRDDSRQRVSFTFVWASAVHLGFPTGVMGIELFQLTRRKTKGTNSIFLLCASPAAGLGPVSNRERTGKSVGANGHPYPKTP